VSEAGGREPRLAVSAFVPVACAVAAVLVSAGIGLTERSFAGTPVEDNFYGFFFRQHPLFLYAAVYGLARIVLVATEPGPRRPLRLLTTPVAVALFLAACFYPTFGGIVLRSGFGTGSMSFITGQTAALSLALGAGASAFIFGLVLGIAAALAKASFRVTRRSLATAALSFLALWLGALVFLAPASLGTDLAAGFPVRPLAWPQALSAAGVVTLALLPHALVRARRP
jgi:hypothetical protein